MFLEITKSLSHQYIRKWHVSWHVMACMHVMMNLLLLLVISIPSVNLLRWLWFVINEQLIMIFLVNCNN